MRTKAQTQRFERRAAYLHRIDAVDAKMRQLTETSDPDNAAVMALVAKGLVELGWRKPDGC